MTSSAPVRSLPLRRAATLATLFVMAVSSGAVAQSPDPAGSPEPVAPATEATALDGTWSVDPTIGSFDYAASDFSGTWAGYRVQEELVGVGGTEAVGRTPDVSGSITLEGTSVTSAELSADLTTLRSDQSMRDGQLGRQGIETDRFPTATFVLTEPIELESLPAEGEGVSVEAVGDLTLHGVTQNVTIPLAAIWSGDIIGVSGALTFTWDTFDMQQPNSMRVVSLANDVTLELQVFFRQQAAAA